MMSMSPEEMEEKLLSATEKNAKFQAQYTELQRRIDALISADAHFRAKVRKAHQTMLTFLKAGCYEDVMKHLAGALEDDEKDFLSMN